MSEARPHHRLIIIGSGPAGLTAALYAARADLAPLCIEGIEAGGQLMQTTEVENFPGFPEGLMGPDLMLKFRAQAERFGTQFITDNVTAVDFSQRPFAVTVADTTHTADAVIISTGATARQLGVPGELEYAGRGVSYCATCDGFFFRDRRLVVVGGGDSAMEEAIFLTKFASKVTIVHRRDEYRASQIMLDRARANEKIEFVEWAAVNEIHGENGAVSAVTLRDPRDDRTWTLETDGVFVAVGHDPNTALFAGTIDLDEDGYIVPVNPPTTHTNIAGVFACGDVQDSRYRQAVTAAGSGCAAALDVEKWLADQDEPEVTNESTRDAATAR